MIRRRGFTLIEVLVASAAATTLLAVLYSTLIWYSRGAQREDESLERSRRAQEVFGLFRDDFGRAGGDLALEDIPLEPLKECGWDGSAADFAIAPRAGRHQVNSWTGYGAGSPYSSKIHEFTEKWDTRSENGQTRAFFNASGSAYDRDAPNENVRTRIAPRSPDAAVIHVMRPREQPRSEWILIRRESAGNATVALWSFHRDKVGRISPGTLLRHTAATGTVKVGGPAVADFTVRLAHDWMFVDAAPPGRPKPDVRHLSTIARVGLKYQGGFESSAVLLRGP